MRFLILFVPLFLMLIGLPLTGVIVSGKPLALYFEFPPRTVYVVHAVFSWWAFAATTLLILVVVFPFLNRVVRFRMSGEENPVAAGYYPCWGWLAVAWLIAVWLLAWNRFAWFAPFQVYTFSMLWIGYIVTVNALTWWRTGRCMLTNRPGYLLALVPLSATFWWYFEYLNRFVQNWFYIDISILGPWDYFWQATLSFATVLPAVLGTRELLATFPGINGGLENAWTMTWMHLKRIAWTLLIVSAVGLAAIGVWPHALFSLLWLAPLALITALQLIMNEKTILDGPVKGDWREIWQGALAGLVCGFFWEMWNFGSLSHWEYSVPFVQRFEIFHMPLLGYSGYLPFGLECLAAAKMLDVLWQHKRQA